MPAASPGVLPPPNRSTSRTSPVGCAVPRGRGRYRAAAEVAAEDAYRAVIDAQLLAAELDEATGSMKARRGKGRWPGRRLAGALTSSEASPTSCGTLLTREPRTLLKTLLISLASGLLYLGCVRFANWDEYGPSLPFLAVLVVSTIMGGGAYVNAIAFDAQRVRDALDRGIRRRRIIVVKNVSLGVVVFPVGLLISLMLASSSGRWRDAARCADRRHHAHLAVERRRQRALGDLAGTRRVLKRHLQEHAIRTFVVAFGISWAISYGVNAVLIWRYLAARQLAGTMGLTAARRGLVRCRRSADLAAAHRDGGGDPEPDGTRPAAAAPVADEPADHEQPDRRRPTRAYRHRRLNWPAVAICFGRRLCRRTAAAARCWSRT